MIANDSRPCSLTEDYSRNTHFQTASISLASLNKLSKALALNWKVRIENITQKIRKQTKPIELHRKSSHENKNATKRSLESQNSARSERYLCSTRNAKRTQLHEYFAFLKRKSSFFRRKTMRKSLSNLRRCTFM